MRAWRWLRENSVMIVAVLVIFYMLAPIAVIAVFSFNDPTGRFNFEWVGFTTKYWQDPFAINELTDSLLVSIRLAFFTSIGATTLGTLIAIALVRYQFMGRKAANLLIVIPMATPEVVIGASLLSMFLVYGVNLGFTTLLIAHIMFSISFVVVVVRSRLIGFDRRLEEASADLGASPVTTLPQGHAAADRAGRRCCGDAFFRALDRRLRDLQLQLGRGSHLPALHLRCQPARHPGRGQRDRDDALRGDRDRDARGDHPAAPGREDDGEARRRRQQGHGLGPDLITLQPVQTAGTPLPASPGF